MKRFAIIAVLLVFSPWALALEAPQALIAETDLDDPAGTTISLRWQAPDDGSVATVVERSTDNRHFSPIAEVPAGRTSYDDTKLEHGRLYIYRVHPKGAPQARSNWNFAATADRLSEDSGGPEHCWARLEPDGTVVVTWLDPLADEQHYLLERRLGSGDYVQIAQLDPDTISYSDSSVPANSAAQYRVRAVIIGPDRDDDGALVHHYSPYSGAGFVSPWIADLAAPAGLAASQVHTSRVELSWDAVLGATDYLLEVSKNAGRSYTSLGSTEGASSYAHVGTVAGMAYRYRIRASNDTGSSLPSAAITFTPTFDESIAPPTDLSVSENADGDIELSWSDNADDEIGYAIEGGDQMQWERIATLPPNSTRETLVGGSSFRYYRVQALGSNGDSRYSWRAQSRYSSDGVPSGLAVTARSASSITLEWTPAGGYASQCIQRAQGDGPFRTIVYLDDEDSTYTDWHLPSDTNYRYRVALTYDMATLSEAISTSTKANTATPAAPTALAASGVARDQINLLWDDDSNNESGFEIQRASDGGNFATVATVAANADGWCDTGVTLGSSYTYRVRAISDADASAWSGTATASPATTDPSLAYADVQHPNHRQLEITGTAANDRISISADGDQLIITANGERVTRTGPYDVIIVRGHAGADSIELEASVGQRAYLYGDEHADSLRTAGTGRCFLVALGGGGDRLVGNGVDSTYWCDPRDTVEASPREHHWQRVHCIDRFEPFWTRDPSKKQFITTEPDGRRWKDRPVELGGHGIHENGRYPDAPFHGGSPVLFDVNQGLYQNCPLTGYYQCAADQQPERVADGAIPLGDGTYAVHCGDGDSAVYARVDGDVWDSYMGQLGPQGQQWFLIMEKVFTGFRMPMHQPSGTTATALPTGQSLYFEGDPERLYGLIRGALDKDQIVLCWSSGDPLASQTIRQGHNHGIVEAYRDAEGVPWVIVRNPYGVTVTSWDAWPLHRTEGLMRMPVSELQKNFITGSISSWTPAGRSISMRAVRGGQPLPLDASLEPGPMRVTPESDETHVFTGLAPAADHRLRARSAIDGDG
ncbi:MAG: hypothetical protein ACOCXA_00745 [Planctomycetota bacterium]